MAPLIRLVTLALVAVLTLQTVAAKSFPSLPIGRYLIVPAISSSPPPFPLGADEKGTAGPVVAGGRDNVWTVKETDNGLYTIVAEQTGSPWFTQAAEDRVIVSLIPPPGTWRVEKHNDDSYTIELPSPFWPPRAWTLDSTQPGTIVQLRVMEFPRPGQLWKFVRIEDVYRGPQRNWHM
ncbi:hypothetical protein BGZ93_009787 [Podila epicladia]|nr:hypothetical protein BGZ93_009787 [Podila epicladia]